MVTTSLAGLPSNAGDFGNGVSSVAARQKKERMDVAGEGRYIQTGSVGSSVFGESVCEITMTETLNKISNIDDRNDVKDKRVTRPESVVGLFDVGSSIDSDDEIER